MTTFGAADRFGGIGRLYGDEAFRRLARAHVLVVGLGGVGSWTVEALARSGVGALTLIDGDDVCGSNVNRQLHALDGTFGRPKVDAMAERVHAINPSCRVTTFAEFFHLTTVARHLAGNCDYAVDAIDGVTAKATLIGSCHERGIPVITCGGAGGKVDPLRVRMADLADTHYDRLLMFVRKKLRRIYKFPPAGHPFGVPCVFSPEPVRVHPDPCTAAPPVAASVSEPSSPVAASVSKPSSSVAASVSKPSSSVAASVSKPSSVRSQPRQPEPREDDDALFGDAQARLTCDGRLGSVTFVTGAFGFAIAAHVVNQLVVSQKSG